MTHCYQLEGYNIVVDTCSGSVHAVDTMAYEMIRRFEETDRETLLKELAERFPEEISTRLNM